MNTLLIEVAMGTLAAGAAGWVGYVLWRAGHHEPKVASGRRHARSARIRRRGDYCNCS
ncbi:MAG: hypothetical protein HY820_38915 [Acidobacteria bacterium]|nr:hypothetical protein [Acidobacteriota bacterium]